MYVFLQETAIPWWFWQSLAIEKSSANAMGVGAKPLFRELVQPNRGNDLAILLKEVGDAGRFLLSGFLGNVFFG